MFLAGLLATSPGVHWLSILMHNPRYYVSRNLNYSRGLCWFLASVCLSVLFCLQLAVTESIVGALLFAPYCCICCGFCVVWRYQWCQRLSVCYAACATDVYMVVKPQQNHLWHQSMDRFASHQGCNGISVAVNINRCISHFYMLASANVARS